jgi:glucokinase
VSADLVLAVDWGGTWIRVAAVADGAILARARMRRPAPLEEQYDAVASLAAGVSSGLEATPTALGIGIAGVVQRGLVGTAANLGITTDTDVGGVLRSRTGLPTVVINDVQAAAIGVAGRWRTGLSAVVAMGTGIGGAVLLDGRLLTGLGGAGDFGHVVVEVDGPLCPCGGRGCLEQLVSGRVLAEAAERLAAAGDSPVLAARQTEGQALHAGDLADAASAGEPVATAVLGAAADALAAGLRTVLATLDPDRIVLSGAPLAEATWFGAEVRRRWQLLKPHWARTEVVHVPDDEDAALLGAAAHALDRAVTG